MVWAVGFSWFYHHHRRDRLYARANVKDLPATLLDEDGNVPASATYQGSTVTNARRSTGLRQRAKCRKATVHWVYIFTDNSPRPAAWTNCIWNGPLGSEPDVFTLESWPVGQMPAQRFYNKIISNGF
jgi:hypothetical protein